MKALRKTLIAGSVLATFVLLITKHRSIAAEFASPTGEYNVTISCRTYLSYLPMPVGSSSDKPCFVKISGKDGRDYGEIPVEMIQLANVEWTEDGASIKFVGEWNFKNRTCFYWSKDGHRQIYVKK